MRRIPFLVAALLVLMLGLLLWPRRTPPSQEKLPPAAQSAGTGVESAAAAPDRSTAAAANDSRASAEIEFPFATQLNAPESTIARDLDALSQMFDNWRSNFPREGNPVGENAEITAALMGENRLGLVLIPKGHRAVNDRGELCDRWGTPFRFHQLSGTQMEIRSAGPDRKFATDDDALWSPP